MIKKSSLINNQLINYFNYLIDIELNKPESEQDMYLIDKYSAVIDNLEKGQNQPELSRKARQIKLLKCELNKRTRNKIVHMFGNIAAAICIIITISFISVLSIAAVSGTSPINILEKIGKRIFDLEIGVPSDVDGFTFIRMGEGIKYNSFDELIENENFDISYPTWLPDGVKVESVMMLDVNNKQKMVVKFSSDLITYGVSLESNYNEQDLINSKCLQVITDNFVAYYNYYDGHYLAQFNIGTCSYSVTAPDTETLFKFINGIKGN